MWSVGLVEKEASGRGECRPGDWIWGKWIELVEME